MARTRRPSAPKVKKPESLKALPTLGKKHKTQPLPSLDAGPHRVVDLVDNELARLTAALGSQQLAKKLLKLKKKYPTGTFLELLVMEWLDRKRIKYFYQQWLLGGRILKGGQVVDFILDNGITMMVWECHGNYWHTRGGTPQKDEAQKLALLGLSFQGKKIAKVIALWESRIFTDNRAKREQALQLALSGIEVGK